MDRRDLVWATGAGCASLAVYVRTLAPSVVAELDTPMFQFIGKVLGVAHNPGYPLYVLLTYPIALLPLDDASTATPLASSWFFELNEKSAAGVAPFTRENAPL